MSYYDGTKLLSMCDINGQKPEIYMCTTNRTGGKTTWFNRYMINSFKAGRGKFAILYRFNYELDSIADKFFKDIGSLFFPSDTFSSKRLAAGIYHELYLNDEHCGYAITLNSADQLKKYSHLFSDTNRILFDEFQSETNHYCNDEVNKFFSIHNTIARGQGKQTRYVPVYMIGNPVSLLNPYYTALDVGGRLQKNTHFLKGDGWVLEQGYNESASKAMRESAFNRAFKNLNYAAYAESGKYLNDEDAFIEKLDGYSTYLCTLKYDGKMYAIRAYKSKGIIYCDDRADETFPMKIVVTTDDHEINYVMLRSNDVFLTEQRFFFERGCYRFKNLACKQAVLSALSY